MSSAIPRIAVIAGALVLLTAVVLQALPKPTAFHYELKQPLAKWLPEAVQGWSSEDVPVASTPEVQEAVNELLNFTDGIYRVYRSESTGKAIKVYVAYWLPGKMDPRLVGVHSPDVCWVGAGWKQIGDKHRLSLEGTDGTILTNGHDRTFEIDGHREEVVFWHLVGGQPSRYLEPGEKFWTLGEVLRNPLDPRYEQFFVRISTTGPLSDVTDDPMMKAIVERLSAVQAAAPQLKSQD
jgi:hypothetical protein